MKKRLFTTAKVITLLLVLTIFTTNNSSMTSIVRARNHTAETNHCTCDSQPYNYDEGWADDFNKDWDDSWNDTSDESWDDSWNDDSNKSSDDSWTDDADATTEDEDIASYTVNKGAITLSDQSDPLDAKQEAASKLIWQRVTQLIPEKYLAMITRFDLFTDGEDGILAYVSNTSEDTSKWMIALDANDMVKDDGSLKEDFNFTVLHEFGHIISIGKDQMQDSKKIQDPNTYKIVEGTLTSKSYLNVFYKEFWASIIDDYNKLNSKADIAEGISSEAFMEKYYERFVTDYAATNPEEDFAESFASFVVSDRPTGHSVMDQKLQFFYKYPELVAYRDSVRLIKAK